MAKREKIDEQMQAVLEWSRQKRLAGHEPPWIWYQLYKLEEAITALQHPTEMSIPLGDSRGLGERPERADLLSADIYRIDSARRHRDQQREPPPK
jgi:hypothetical protein